MANRPFKSVRGKRMRLTRLDNCGRLPAAGDPNSFLVSDGAITVQYSSVIEDGPEITNRGITGAIIINEKLPNSFKRIGLEITFAGVNPGALSLVSNAEDYMDASGDLTGFTLEEGTIEKWFAFELWTGIAGAMCEEGEEDASGYLLLPFVNAGTIGDITVDGENSINFAMTGAYTRTGNQWGVGPYNVMYDETDAPGPLPTALNSRKHFLATRVGVAPPPMADDLQPMVDAGGLSTTVTTTTTA